MKTPADECSFAGIVKAHVAAKEHGIQLIVGSELRLEEGLRLVALVPSRAAYSELSGLISMARRRSPKGEYRVALRDVVFHLKRCLMIWLPQADDETSRAYGLQLSRLCHGRLWLGVSHLLGNNEVQRYLGLYQMAQELDIPMVACGDVRMHVATRKPLLDVFTALYHNTSIERLGRRRLPNSQQHLRAVDKLRQLYPPALLEETQRLKTITRSLLLLAQADAGQLKLTREPVDLTATLENLIEDAKILAEASKLSFEIEWPASAIVQADRALLHTALLNLLVNAVKYNEPGGRIQIRLTANDAGVTLDVGNSGPGIAPAEQEKIFNRFHRVEAARSRHVDGLGLGLSLAREIIRAHGGELALRESRPGWTVFELRL